MTVRAGRIQVEVAAPQYHFVCTDKEPSVEKRALFNSPCTEPEKETFVAKRARFKSLLAIPAATTEADELSGDEDDVRIAQVDQELSHLDSQDEEREQAEEKSTVDIEIEKEGEEEEEANQEDLDLIDDGELMQPTQLLQEPELEQESEIESIAPDSQEAEQRLAAEETESTGPSPVQSCPPPAGRKRSRRIAEK